MQLGARAHQNWLFLAGHSLYARLPACLLIMLPDRRIVLKKGNGMDNDVNSVK